MRQIPSLKVVNIVVNDDENLESSRTSIFKINTNLEYDKGLTVKFSLCDRSKDKNVDENTAKKSDNLWEKVLHKWRLS